MTVTLAAIGLAFWFGLLTAISPCPMATNIAAVSYIGKRLDSPRMTLIAGLLYTFGRLAAYSVLAMLIVSAVLVQSQISAALTSYMNKVLGPVLIILGVIMLELVPFNFSIGAGGSKVQKIADSLGLLGALLLGVVFALAFCPTSAVLYFANLIPLSVTYSSPLLLPVVYGIGTALPVILFSALLAFSANKVGSAYDKLTVFARWAKLLTGIVFLGVGFYFTFIYIYGV
ncbi:MAG: aromatic aminobenezylarsenical efflux permease ArsG family transporter [Planctomycetota bacterium]